MMRATFLLMITSACLACGCAAPTTRVVLEFTESDGTALAGAHVRAVALGKNDVPLPVTQETLGQVFAQGSLVGQGWTDRSGMVELRLLSRNRHALEVSESPLTDSPIPAIWRWLLSPNEGVISPIPVSFKAPQIAPIHPESDAKPPSDPARDVEVRVVMRR